MIRAVRRSLARPGAGDGLQAVVGVRRASVLWTALLRRPAELAPDPATPLGRDEIAAIECLRQLYAERRWPDLLNPPPPKVKALPGLVLPPAPSAMPSGKPAVVERLKEYFVSTRASKNNSKGNRLRIREQRPEWLDWWWEQADPDHASQHGRQVADQAFERIFSRWAFLGVVEGSRERFRWNAAHVVHLIETESPVPHPAIRRTDPAAASSLSPEEIAAAARQEADEVQRKWSTTVFLAPGDAEALMSGKGGGTQGAASAALDVTRTGAGRVHERAGRDGGVPARVGSELGTSAAGAAAEAGHSSPAGRRPATAAPLPSDPQASWAANEHDDRPTDPAVPAAAPSPEEIAAAALQAADELERKWSMEVMLAPGDAEALLSGRGGGRLGAAGATADEGASGGGSEAQAARPGGVPARGARDGGTTAVGVLTELGAAQRSNANGKETAAAAPLPSDTHAGRGVNGRGVNTLGADDRAERRTDHDAIAVTASLSPEEIAAALRHEEDELQRKWSMDVFLAPGDAKALVSGKGGGRVGKARATADVAHTGAGAGGVDEQAGREGGVPAREACEIGTAAVGVVAQTGHCSAAGTPADSAAPPSSDNAGQRATAATPAPSHQAGKRNAGSASSSSDTQASLDVKDVGVDKLDANYSWSPASRGVNGVSAKKLGAGTAQVEEETQPARRGPQEHRGSGGSSQLGAKSSSQPTASGFSQLGERGPQRKVRGSPQVGAGGPSVRQAEARIKRRQADARPVPPLHQRAHAGWLEFDGDEYFLAGEGEEQRSGRRQARGGKTKR